MSAIWKLLGAAAALAGLAPYKVNKDEETGEVKVKALLWNATYAPATEEKSKTVDVHFGLNVPGKEKEDETHIYTDDVTVSYAAEEKAGENAEAAPEAAEEKAEEAAPAAEAVEQKSPRLLRPSRRRWKKLPRLLKPPRKRWKKLPRSRRSLRKSKAAHTGG